jgi:hypothetical protein
VPQRTSAQEQRLAVPGGATVLEKALRRTRTDDPLLTYPVPSSSAVAGCIVSDIVPDKLDDVADGI